MTCSNCAEGRHARHHLHRIAVLLHPFVYIYIGRIDGRVPQCQKDHRLVPIQQRLNLLGCLPVAFLQQLWVAGHRHGDLHQLFLVEYLLPYCPTGNLLGDSFSLARFGHSDKVALFKQTHRLEGHQFGISGSHSDSIELTCHHHRSFPVHIPVRPAAKSRGSHRFLPDSRRRWKRG